MILAKPTSSTPNEKPLASLVLFTSIHAHNLRIMGSNPIRGRMEFFETLAMLLIGAMSMFSHNGSGR